MSANAPSSVVSNQIFNVGSTNQNFQIGDIGKMIKEELPSCHYLIKKDIDDPRNYKVNFSKIESKLGFKPEVTVQKGIKQIIEFLSQQETNIDYRKAVYSNFTTLNNKLNT